MDNLSSEWYLKIRIEQPPSRELCALGIQSGCYRQEGPSWTLPATARDLKQSQRCCLFALERAARVGLKRRRTGPAFSFWGGYHGIFYCGAPSGQVAVLGTQEAIATATTFGHVRIAYWLHSK
jgi:hypothetical protein